MTEDEIYEYLGQTFEWNHMKAARNARRHGVRFTEAVTVFFDVAAKSFVDEGHSDDEDRYNIIGHSIHSRKLFVVHVERGERVRIISARTATDQERRDYESRLGRRL
jgi:uncharacterized DUF497 family protein